MGIEPTTCGLDHPLLCRLYVYSAYVPLLSLRAIHYLKSSPTFSVRPRSSVGMGFITHSAILRFCIHDGSDHEHEHQSKWLGERNRL